MRLQLIEKPIIEICGEEAIIIFPSRPYWFSATKEIREVLNVLLTEVEKTAVIRTISKHLNISETEAGETIDEIQDLLFTNKVLLIDGQPSTDLNVMEPHFQVNAVENVLVMAATQGCNLSCLHCYASARNPLPDEMTTQEIKGIIDQLANMSWKNEVSRIGLTGGEFLMRSDALEIISYINGRGFKVLLSSNGLLLNRELIAVLASYPGLKISVSLDGPTAKIHEIIRGKETFQKTINNISLLTEAGVHTGINMFVHQGNFEHIESTLSLSHRLGVKAFNCLNMMMVGRANSCLSKQKIIRISEKMLNRRLFEILRRHSEFQRHMVNSTFANQVMGIAAGIKSHYCGIGTNRALYVKADGNVYPCPDTATPNFLLGNIRGGGLENIWEKSPILEELRTLSVDSMNETCTACDVRYFCGGGCRGENYQVTKDLYSPHFDCHEKREVIIDLMRMLTEEPTFFQEKVDGLYEKICI